MSETDTPDENQISDDDWAAAMQEQAAAEGLTDPAEPAEDDGSPTRPSPPASSSRISARPAPRADQSTITT
jgi:hypothetical protein